MVFPPDYIFPPDRSHGVRTFLSKGVCPPVATWILDNIRQHIFQAAQGSEFTGPGGYLKTIIPGKIVSFKPGRNTLLEHLEEMQSIGCPESDELIELRDDRDDGDEED
jgi:hypothetical protein